MASLSRKNFGKKKSLFANIVVVSSIAAMAALASRRILAYYFTGGDSLFLINSSRIESWQDFLNIWTSPLMGRDFAIGGGIFYRPVSSLSYSLDTFFWGANPFGYNLTNMIIHIITAVLVYFLIRHLINRNSVAWIGAVIFAVSPGAMQSIDAPSHRHDALMTLFAVACLLLFFGYLRSRGNKRFLYFSLSLVSFSLAIGAKEIGIIIPAVLFSYLLLFGVPGEDETLTKRAGAAFKMSFPFLILDVAFFSWRLYVLHGLGGYQVPPNTFFGTIKNSVKNSMNYLFDLFYPGDIAVRFFTPFPGELKKTAVIIVLSLGFSLFAFYGWKLINEGSVHTNRMKSGLGRLLFIVLPAASIVFIGIGSGLLLSKAISVSLYVIFFFISLSMLIIVILKTKLLKRIVRDEGNSRFLIFLIVWLALPLMVFLVTRNFDDRYMYFPAVAASAIFAFLIVEIVNAVRASKTEQVSSGKDTGSRELWSRNYLIIAISGLIVCFLIASPLVRRQSNYDNYKRSILFNNLSPVFQGIPNNVNVEIDNFPSCYLPFSLADTTPEQLLYVQAVDIKSWLNLYKPGNNNQIHVFDRTDVNCPDNVKLEVVQKDPNNVVIRFGDDV